MSTLLAIKFRSYLQPVIIIATIPFSIIGSVFGMMFVLDLSILSMFVIVAFTGVVVNDSLLLIDFINQKRGRWSNSFMLFSNQLNAGSVLSS